MTIQEILQIEEIDKVIQQLKNGRNIPLPDIDTLNSEWDPKKHKTMIDKVLLPDRIVKADNGTTLQPVNRLAFPFQKKIVNTAVSFAFGNPIKYISEPETSDEELIYKAIGKVDNKAKLRSFNRKMFREMMRSTEVAELWYVVETNTVHNEYGFPTKFKVRPTLLQPSKGEILYPYFDALGDMIAFSREFQAKNDAGKLITFFEVFTDTQKIIYKKELSGWEISSVAPIIWGKIPVIFGSQEVKEWADVQIAIERLELLLSRFAETNDYHAAPKIFVKGKIVSLSKKGDSGSIIEGELGSEASYLSWDHAPESVKLEIETLLRFIYGMTQTPDISFDSVKGLAAISGEALKMLFLDAHLKVLEKKEILDDYLQRRTNLLISIVGILANKEAAADSITIEPELVPYSVNDTSSMIANLVNATGGKPILSQYTAIQKLGWVDDIDAEMTQIASENEADASFSLFEPTTM